MMHKGLFITIEGGEGAGKSTLIQTLKSSLESDGFKVRMTREPGGSSTGEQIRNLLLHQPGAIAPMAELLLFLASRAQHISELIQPELEKGVIVLCDRFNDSTIAYQGIARGLGYERVRNLCETACGDPQPDLTFWIDIPPAEGLKRAMRSMGAHDRIEKESLDFHTKVREGFMTIAKDNPQRVVHLNGMDPPHLVAEQAYRSVECLKRS